MLTHLCLCVKVELSVFVKIETCQFHFRRNLRLVELIFARLGLVKKEVISTERSDLSYYVGTWGSWNYQVVVSWMVVALELHLPAH